MPRRGENIYKRKDGRWEGRIKKPDGTYRSVYGKTYGIVKNKKEEQSKSPPPPKPEPGRNRKADEAYTSWLAGDIRGRVKPSTYQNYYFCMKKYVLPFFREPGNERITEESVRLFVKSVENNAAVSVSCKRKVLSIFMMATREILKGSNEYSVLAGTVRLPKVKGSSVQVFTVKEQRQIETCALKSSDLRALGIVLCFYTGIRLGELCALKWGDIDTDAGTMSIARTVSRTKNFQEKGRKTTLLVGAPKSQKSARKIPLPAFFLKIFKVLRTFSKNEGDYILTNLETPMDPRTYQRLYKKVLEDAGVKYRKFHTTRHTFATRALELNVDIKTLSEILGHSNVSITLNIYAHSLMEQKKIAIDRLNQMYLAHANTVPIAVMKSVLPV